VNVLDQIMGVQEAAELWGLSADRVKGMCQSGDVKAKKIGNSWVLDRNQTNPKKYRKGEDKMKVFYEGILVADVVTNRSMTVDEALELVGFDEKKFCEEQGFDVDEGLDPNEFKVEY